jgi:uncharacterized membrane protein
MKTCWDLAALGISLTMVVLVGCHAPSDSVPPNVGDSEESTPWADAEQRGATVRARGNEPFWNLEIHPGRLILVTDLGETRTEMPYRDFEADPPTQIWRASADGETLEVVIEQRPCADSMSDEEFEASATVTFNGEILQGCARLLTPPL